MHTSATRTRMSLAICVWSIAVKWLLLGLVTVYGPVNHLGI